MTLINPKCDRENAIALQSDAEVGGRTETNVVAATGIQVLAADLPCHVCAPP
jgi:hypothetical protein